jgi:hypothetical protein
MQTSKTYMIRRRARVHQQCDYALLVTCRTKRDNSGTRRSPGGRLGRDQSTHLFQVALDPGDERQGPGLRIRLLLARVASFQRWNHGPHRPPMAPPPLLIAARAISGRAAWSACLDPLSCRDTVCAGDAASERPGIRPALAASLMAPPTPAGNARSEKEPLTRSFVTRPTDHQERAAPGWSRWASALIRHDAGS